MAFPSAPIFFEEDSDALDEDDEWDAAAAPSPLLQLQRSKSAEQGRELLKRGLSGGEEDESDCAAGGAGADSTAGARNDAATLTTSATAADVGADNACEEAQLLAEGKSKAAGGDGSAAAGALAFDAAAAASEPRKGGWSQFSSIAAAQEWRGGQLPAWALTVPAALVKAARAEICRGLVDGGDGGDGRAHLGGEALYKAAKAGNDARVKALLCAGANVNHTSEIDEYHDTALMAAVRKGDAAVVQALADAGADLERETPVGPGDAEIVYHMRRELRANPDSGVTPLYVAAKEAKQHVLRVLIKSGANIDHTNLMGATALMIAAQFGYKKIAKLLIQAGANTALQLTTHQQWHHHPAGSTARQIAERKAGSKYEGGVARSKPEAFRWGDAFWRQKKKKKL